jgi:hypothetical protein
MAASISDSGLTFSDNAAAPQIFSIATPVLSAGAMTITLNPCTATFRATALSTGGLNTVTLSSSRSITIPSGATLGTTNAVTARLAILLAYNSGTPVLCVTNLTGGANIDENTLISPTAISASSTSSSTIYSSGLVASNSPFRVVGFIDSTQATAGSYLTAPNVIGGGVPQLGSMMSLGFGQTWQIVTGSRAIGTTYYNTTGRPILLFVSVSGVTAGTANSGTININSVAIGYITGYSSSAYSSSFIIPAGGSYSVTNTGGINLLIWSELR